MIGRNWVMIGRNSLLPIILIVRTLRLIFELWVRFYTAMNTVCPDEINSLILILFSLDFESEEGGALLLFLYYFILGILRS